jgi:hypothetical protein
MKLQLIPCMMVITILITACVLQTPCQSQTESMPDEQLARTALINFFAYLQAEQYNTAADLYGGSYEIMIQHNPDLDPDDRAALWQAACRINGAQCLEVEQATWEVDAQVPESVFQFSVVFRNEDGSTFSLGACCGDEDGNRPPQREFPFSVKQQAEGLFIVLDPPIYAP